MSLTFDLDQVSLPIGHFIGDRLLESPGLLPIRRPSEDPCSPAITEEIFGRSGVRKDLGREAYYANRRSMSVLIHV